MCDCSHPRRKVQDSHREALAILGSLANLSLATGQGHLGALKNNLTWVPFPTN